MFSFLEADRLLAADGESSLSSVVKHQYGRLHFTRNMPMSPSLRRRTWYPYSKQQRVVQKLFAKKYAVLYTKRVVPDEDDAIETTELLDHLHLGHKSVIRDFQPMAIFRKLHVPCI